MGGAAGRRELVDAVTQDEAAHILGVAKSTLRRWMAAGVLPSGRRRAYRQLGRAEVEALALSRYRAMRPDRDPYSYWVNTMQAARILGVNHSRVQQLADAGRVPYEVTPAGVRLFRRHQLEVVGNARLARRLQR